MFAANGSRPPARATSSAADTGLRAARGAECESPSSKGSLRRDISPRLIRSAALSEKANGSDRIKNQSELNDLMKIRKEI